MDAWLEQFGPKRAIVSAWFAACRVPGQSTPDLLHRVSETVARRLGWAPAKDTEQLCQVVLLALVHQRPQAERFAASFLEQERPV